MRISHVLPLLAALLLLGGCLESTETITVKPDGSGTITSTYASDLEKGEQIMMMAGPAFGLDPAAPMPDPLAEGWFRKAADGIEGFEIVKFERSDAEKVRTTKVQSKFKSLEAAAKAGAFFTSNVSLEQVNASEIAKDGETPGEGEKKDAKVWKLVLLDVIAGDFGGQMRPKDMLMMFEQFVNSLEIERSIVPPSKILETNGTLSEDGKSVSWTVDYQKIVKSTDKLEMVVYFECREDVKLQPFTYSPSLESLLERGSKPPPEIATVPVITGAGSEGDAPGDGEGSKDADK